MAAAVPPPPSDGVEVLKRVKATETEWESRVAEAKKAAEAEIAGIRTETDAMIKSATETAEDEHESALTRARADAEREVSAILADGERRAAEAARAEGKHPKDQKDQILSVVLGSFRQA
jgi:vacuolar-type H+-ATPase subunit H